MEVVDSQIHEFAPRLEWPKEGEARYRVAVEAALAAMDAAGVAAAVISAPDEFCEFAATVAPGRLASVMSVVDAPPGTAEMVAGVRDRPGVLGIRVAPVSRIDQHLEPLRSGQFDPVFAAAVEHAVPVCIFMSGTLELVPDIVRKHPDLNLIIDHLGLPQPPLEPLDDALPGRIREMVELASYPNISVKFIGAPTLAREPFPFTDVWETLMPMIEAFGPDRLMWGSDITRIQLRFPDAQPGIAPDRPDYPGKHSYGEAVDFLKLTDRLSADDKQRILGGTLRRVLNWPRDEEAAAG